MGTNMPGIGLKRRTFLAMLGASGATQHIKAAGASIDLSDPAGRSKQTAITDQSGVDGQAGASAAPDRATPIEFALPMLAPTTSVATIFPIEHFSDIDVTMGAGSGGTIHASTDAGATWSPPIASAPATGRLIRLLGCTGGEVLAVGSTVIQKSSGWRTNPKTATWKTVLSVNPAGGCSFQKFGIDGDGTKFIAAEYGAPGPVDPATTSSAWANSRYVWISLDAGSTWKRVWDTEARFPGRSGTSHLHAACYDRWDDRFWFTEGHGVPRGAYFSDDDGATWTAINKGTLPDPMPTVMVATDDGIVCGTDSDPTGVYGILRQKNPADLHFTMTYRWRTGIEGLVGFAQRGWRDENTGLVWIGFGAVIAGTKPIIAAGTAGRASEVYRDPTGKVDDRYWQVFVTNSGTVVAHQLKNGADVTMRAVGGGYGQRPVLDSGGLEGGVASASGVAVGLGSSVTGLRGVAVGLSALFRGFQDGVVVGGAASGTESNVVAIGYLASATATDAVAIGRGASVAGPQGVAVGRGSIIAPGAFNAVAVGNRASTPAGDSVAVGAAATGAYGRFVGVGAAVSGTAGTQQTLVGYGATSNKQSTVAVGALTTANHFESTALGAGVSTSADRQVAIGNRHVELKESTTATTAPAANTARLWVEDNGSGKTRLVVQFATGPKQVIATQL